ncbi:MAG: M14 family zinc carboxypeptidase [Candidatus Gracilibacteria bacterium]|nr:M14 family zinc carboxypeptidase [Candidatus Gracilibacteria bacterium]
MHLKTGINGCNSEKETKTVINTLETYKFNKIISLHSVGGNFFIPDNSFNDNKVISLANEMKTILPHYDFDISYSNLHEKEEKIFAYEIDEGGSNKFTGTMETYIYEKYDIPIIIIELEEHGKIEYNLLNIIK